jgi:hypothetical protein
MRRQSFFRQHRQQRVPEPLQSQVTSTSYENTSIQNTIGDNAFAAPSWLEPLTPYNNYQKLRKTKHGHGNAAREHDDSTRSTTDSQETSSVATATAFHDVRHNVPQTNHPEPHETRHGGGNSARQHPETAQDLTHRSHFDAANGTHASKLGSHTLNI